MPVRGWHDVLNAHGRQKDKLETVFISSIPRAVGAEQRLLLNLSQL